MPDRKGDWLAGDTACPTVGPAEAVESQASYAAASQAELEVVAKGSTNAKPFLEGKPVKKVIVLPKTLVNLVVG